MAEQYVVNLVTAAHPPLTLTADRVTFELEELIALVESLPVGSSVLYVQPGPTLAVTVSLVSAEEEE